MSGHDLTTCTGPTTLRDGQPGVIGGSADRAFDSCQPGRRVRATRPATLLRQILSRGDLGVRYRDVKLIQRGDRPIMEEICAKVARSGIPGVYIPDPPMAGTMSLADLVALWVASAGDEEGVAAGLERLAQFGFIEVTEYGCILLPAIIKSAANSSASNGRMSIGRRRNGESKAEYSARAAAHRAAIQAQGPPHPSAAEALGRDLGKRVVGDALARMLRSPLPNRAAGKAGSRKTTQAGTRATPTSRPKAANGRTGGGAAWHPSPPAPPIASAPAQAPTDSAMRPALVQEPGPKVPICPSPDAIDMAELAAKRCNWSNKHRQQAPEIFQSYLDQGSTTQQLRHVIVTQTARCCSATAYGPPLERMRMSANQPPFAEAGSS